MLGDVSPVVLGVDPPVHLQNQEIIRRSGAPSAHLQVVPSSHLQPAHAARVPREVGHVVQPALATHDGHVTCNM